MMLKILGREEEMLQETNRMILSPDVFERINQRLEDAEHNFEAQPVSGMLEKMKDIHSESQWDEICPEVLTWLEKEKGEYRGL